MRTRFLVVVLLAQMLAACSGGSDNQGSGPNPDSTVADGEAARVAAIYRYMQGMGSLMISNLTEVDIGETRAGITACSGGGSVTYTDTTSTADGDPTALIAFDDCVEAIGLVDGFIEVRQFLVRLQPSGFGDFNVGFNTDVTIDGYGMSFESVTGRTFLLPDGSIQIEVRNGADNAAVLTAPDGVFAYLDDAKINLLYSPSSDSVDFGASVIRIVDPQDSNLGARAIFGDFVAPVRDGSGLLSVGIPQSGGFTYDRSFDPTSTDLEGRGTTQNGLLDLTLDPLPPSRDFSGDAGQYSWQLILESPLLSLPAGEP